MRVYLYDETGRYIGHDMAQESPREPGVFIMPPNSTQDEPPESTSKKSPVWNGDKWKLEQDPEKMTRKEKIEAGLEKREKGFRADGEPATYDEQVALGDITEEVAKSLKLRDILSARQNAYMWESDPILAKYQRGEATKEEWLAKIAEIKTRFPKESL